MPETIEINTNFALAIDYVNTTNEHLYLTGKAGTGKTTFLKYIKEHCHKKLAIAAPTGVAAMNAGGVTLHSLFQLPLGSFIPEADSSGNESSDFFDRKSLLKHLRLNKAKRELLQELELLIIDEVSMLRSDLLDAIDTILKSIRRKARLPFGGVQVLFIGDLFQLPPVIRNSEWHVLRKYYTSPSFFSAKVLTDFPPIYLELKNIYRQSDENFIRVLNNIRHDEMTAEDLDLLNAYYQPDFKPEKEGEYIILTTHNNKADIINRDQLAKLSGTIHTFKATITGDFNENNVTAETELKLKEGAQVMFIRNDKGEKPRYYNGKIGVVKSIKGETITVVFQDSDDSVTVEKETWENKRYKLNKETDILEEDVKGTFTQFPIRLAWAITIHKSQGLTFDKAIIDAGGSFAAGQVYVALSRLTSLDGLVLHSKISGDSISSDASAVAFSKQEKESELLKEQLEQSRVGFIRDMLLKGFDWRKLTWTIKDFIQEMADKRIPEKEKAMAMMQSINQVLKSQQETADKFTSQLNGLLDEAQKGQYAQVHARTEAAANYFSKGLKNEVFDLLEEHYKSMKVKSGVKKYLKEVYELMAAAKHKHQHLKELVMLTEGLTKQADLSKLFGEISAQRKATQKKIEAEVKETHKPKVKGESQRLSLEMFQNGKTIEEIATTRSLSPSTIEGHIVSFIGTELELSQFMNDEKATRIKTVIDSLKEPTLTEVKAKLGDEYSYSDVRAVQNSLKSTEKQS
ncbi:helix-turn-helix domain-containing protein [Reichenbachiella sp. MALMAid0571]|uniref:helix-turn-helix domain-containing protein n=1 Tax=Reichenbachiella sp. MALMAid0571 TaxID=3143939 RepID=UPI0032DEE3CE